MDDCRTDRKSFFQKRMASPSLPGTGYPSSRFQELGYPTVRFFYSLFPVPWFYSPRPQKPRHHLRHPFPLRGLLRHPFPPCRGQRIKSGAAPARRHSPFRLDPSPFLQARQRRMDRSLVQPQPAAAHLAAAHILDPPRNAVPVQRTHRFNRLQNHQVQRPLQNFRSLLTHLPSPVALLHV